MAKSAAVQKKPAAKVVDKNEKKPAAKAVQKKPAAKAQKKPEGIAGTPWVPLNCSALFADAGEMRWSCSRDFVSLDGGVDSFYTDYNWRFNKELETGLEAGRMPVYKLTYTLDPIDSAEPALLRG